MDSDLSFSSSNSSLGLKHVTINIDQDQEYRKDERDQAKSFKQGKLFWNLNIFHIDFCFLCILKITD